MNYDYVLAITEAFRRKLTKSCKLLSATSCGLDTRCGSVWIGDGFLASDQSRMLDYYGGFEYVSDEHKTHIGSFTFYSIEDARVANHYNRGLDNAEAA